MADMARLCWLVDLVLAENAARSFGMLDYSAAHRTAYFDTPCDQVPGFRVLSGAEVGQEVEGDEELILDIDRINRRQRERRGPHVADRERSVCAPDHVLAADGRPGAHDLIGRRELAE